MSKPSHRLVVSGGRASLMDGVLSKIRKSRSAPSNTTIRNGVLGVGLIVGSTLLAGEWGFAASIVVIAILVGYFDSGKHQRRLDSTDRRYGE